MGEAPQGEIFHSTGGILSAGGLTGEFSESKTGSRRYPEIKRSTIVELLARKNGIPPVMKFGVAFKKAMKFNEDQDE